MGIFALCFVSLCWNLIQRSETVGNINLEHISWTDDHLNICTPKTKNNQTGERAEDLDVDKHVYANPKCPFMCPILILAVYFFSTERQGNRLFPGDNQETTFGNILRY
jgi:hypothetical protein